MIHSLAVQLLRFNFFLLSSPCQMTPGGMPQMSRASHPSKGVTAAPSGQTAYEEIEGAEFAKFFPCFMDIADVEPFRFLAPCLVDIHAVLASLPGSVSSTKLSVGDRSATLQSQRSESGSAFTEGYELISYEDTPEARRKLAAHKAAERRAQLRQSMNAGQPAAGAGMPPMAAASGSFNGSSRRNSAGKSSEGYMIMTLDPARR